MRTPFSYAHVKDKRLLGFQQTLINIGFLSCKCGKMHLFKDPSKNFSRFAEIAKTNKPNSMGENDNISGIQNSTNYIGFLISKTHTNHRVSDRKALNSPTTIHGKQDSETMVLEWRIQS